MRYLALLLTTGMAALFATPARADIIYGPRASDAIVLTVGDDISTGPHAIGFAFPFFGVNQANAFMNTNGNLSFGSTFTNFGNTGLPGPLTPLIAPFWDDLILPPGEMRINTSQPGEFVALWSGVQFFASGGTPTFETILLGAGNSFGLADGSILFSYGTIPGTNPISIFELDGLATAGLNNGGGSSATLAGILGTNGNGTLTDGEAQTLSGRSFLFTPFFDRPNGPGYNVTEYYPNTTPVPAPPAVVLVGISAVALAGWRRVRRNGEPALAM